MLAVGDVLSLLCFIDVPNLFSRFSAANLSSPPPPSSEGSNFRSELGLDIEEYRVSETSTAY